jgi:hypothetical protein
VYYFYGDVGLDGDDDDDKNNEIFNLTNVGKNIFSFLFLLKFH